MNVTPGTRQTVLLRGTRQEIHAAHDERRGTARKGELLITMMCEHPSAEFQLVILTPPSELRDARDLLEEVTSGGTEYDPIGPALTARIREYLNKR